MTESDDGDDEGEDDDVTVIFSPEVLERMENDPSLQEAMRFFSETMQTAIEGVKRGQYKTLDDAMEALLGHRPVKYDTDTGEVIEGASMHDEMFTNAGVIDLGDDDDDC